MRARWRTAFIGLVGAACAAAGQAGADPRAHGPSGTQAARVKLADRSSPGKPQAPIAIEHRLSAAPASGSALTVTITARADSTLGALSIEVSGADGAEILGPPRPLSAAAPGEHVWEIEVAPLRAPAGRLNVLVTARAAPGAPGRSLSVPLRTASRAAEVRVEPNGERVIVLPAEESR